MVEGDDDHEPDRRADRGGSGSSEKLAGVAETLLEHLDVAASLVLNLVQDHIIEPLEAVRRQLLLGMVLFAILGLGSIGLGIWNRPLFWDIFPFFFGGVCLLALAAMFYLDQQVKALKQRVRELASKAETWRKVASWAKKRLD